jgi:hypothetical protein
MRINSRFIALITAPGVIAHECGHLLFCFFAGVKIYRVKFFSFNTVAGYVTHDEPKKFLQSLLVSFGPLTFNSFISLILFSQIKPPYFTWLVALYLYLGVVIALHAIPSVGDAKTLFAISKGKLFRSPFAFLGFPLVVVLYILNFLKRYHIHFIYALFLLWLGMSYLKT